MDLLGAGFSDKPDRFPYSVEEHARSILDLLAALDLGEVDLFGHSMGGAIAIAMASLGETRIRRLIVAEPNLDPGGGVFSRGIAAQSESDYATFGHAEVIRAALAEGNVVWAGSMAVSSPLAIHREAMSLVMGCSPSWRDLLLRARLPRTVLFGEHSLPDPDTDRLAKAGLDVRIVPGAGHNMMWENPSGLAEAIRFATA